uniref:Uncharacterized protein n=1 Tax=Octopus bimaculoides TaxID=37653 RepID=A0A0L8H6U8_OCTBM
MPHTSQSLYIFLIVNNYCYCYWFLWNKTEKLCLFELHLFFLSIKCFIQKVVFGLY